MKFPSDFFFGTSTSAYQIETAFEHDWQFVKSKDGFIFNRTTDHELRIDEDIKIISSLSTHYRMGLQWSKLQRAPCAPLDADTVKHYHILLQGLKANNVDIMMVIHHFVNPKWFAETGGWANVKNIDVWCDFAKKLIDEFGHYVSHWNTFNEPNLYITLGYVLGEFPPYQKNLSKGITVARNMGRAHNKIYDYIKKKFDKPVGISHNCVVFGAENVAGKVAAKLADSWYMDFLPEYFLKSDFTGLSYYARVGYDPLPITYLLTPQKIKKLKKPHDDIWEYYPQGLYECIERYWVKYKKPIIITENGICTSDDKKRIKAIEDYCGYLKKALDNGIDVRGYYHWSTWDNFEWVLGPTYQFGLYECDAKTKERRKKPSADVYSKLSLDKELIVKPASAEGTNR
jgi:beta-glucosidase